MSKNKGKGPIIDPGLCRCCGNMKKCRLLNVEYEFLGQPEVYSDMFVDCFGLMLSHLDSEEVERLICAACVVRLRDARSFRAQVLRCEQKLRDGKREIHESDDGDVLNIKSEVKDDDITGDDAHMDPSNDSYSTDDNIDEPPPANQVMQVQSIQQSSLIMKKNALENAITIIENSFVCPFTTVYSDYHCAYCDEMFLDPSKLREHTLTHNPKTFKTVVNSKKLIQIDINRIDCRLCEVKIDNIDTFKTHITSVHGKIIAPNEVVCEFLTFKLEFSTLACLECGKTFYYFHILKKHMAEHFGTFICDECGVRYFEESLFTSHKQSHKHSYKESRRFPCEECGKSFQSNYRRNVHVNRVHKKEPVYRCDKCNDIFETCNVRLQHKIDVHGEKRSLPCEVCHKIFNSRKFLNLHLKSHSFQYPYDCKFCDKKFKAHSGLKNHMPSHTGEMNYTCDYCGNKYSRAKALKVHIESQHVDKKYSCSLCPRSYSQAAGLINHMKSKHPLPEESSLNNYTQCYPRPV